MSSWLVHRPRPIPVALAGAISLFALQGMLSLWGLTLIPGRINHEAAGTFGEWFAAIATLSAVLVALWQSYDERRRAARRDQRDYQRKIGDVTFWVDEGEDEAGDPCSVLILSNNSGGTIFEWSVTSAGAIILEGMNKGPLPPGQTTLVSDADYSRRTVDELKLEFLDREGSRRIVVESGNASEA